MKMKIKRASRGWPVSPGPQEVGAAKVKAEMWSWGLPSVPSSWASCQAVE